MSIDTEFHIVIPARYGSERFPGKPLKDLKGKPMVQRVFEAASKSSAKSITIATDDIRIYNKAKEFTDNVLMTKNTHISGTDRLEEVSQLKSWSDDTVVVNWQGDEPLLPLVAVENVLSRIVRFADSSVSTIAVPLKPELINNPNIVKVVLDQNQFALYFSRASMKSAYRHIGLYAYRVGAIKRFVKYPVPLIEKTEKLEQLRFLYNSEKIQVAISSVDFPVGVDTAEDLEKVLEYI